MISISLAELIFKCCANRTISASRVAALMLRPKAHEMHSPMRRTILTVVKLLLGAAILAYLVFSGRDAFAQLSAKSIDWLMLVAALVFTLLMAGLSYLRWHILIRALGIDARLIDSMRLGSLGFALNFVSPGSIGGDFFKAIFLAHGHPDRRTEAIATIVADRVMGLLTMMLLASIGILATGLLATSSPTFKALYEIILLFSACLWGGCVLLLLVGALTGPWVRKQAESIPVAGKTISRLLGTVQVYRSRKWALLASFLVSMVMALCYVTSYYMVARGLPFYAPTWAEHLVIVPISGLAGAIPLTPSGLGTTEAVIRALYKAMSGGLASAEDAGTLVGVGRRFTDIAVAVIGMVFYFRHRREVREVYAEAEQVAETE
jgi:glycosyltransferase 2 family protein